MRRYLAFAVLSLALFMASLGMSTVAVAFPVIVVELNISLVLAGWILSVYQLVGLSAMPVSAKVSEILGRKRTFMFSALLFTLGSTLCAIASNEIWLIFFRVIQALGSGGLMPSAAGIISEEFPESRQKAIGLFTSIFPIGSILGPNLGGWMVASFGWQSIFWVNVPVGLLVLFFSWRLLPNDRATSSGGIDFLGAGFLTGFLSAFMLALTEVGNNISNIPWLVVGFFAVISISMLVLFLWWERKANAPIIDFEMLRHRPFLAANIYNFVFGASAFGVGSLIPLYAVSVYGMGTLGSGLILTPRSAGMVLASAVTSFYLVRWGYRRPILTGTAVMAVNLILLALEIREVNIFGLHFGSTVWLLIMMALAGIGMGISSPAANNACIELMPQRVAAITGIRGMFRQMGGAISISISTLLLEIINDMPRAFSIVFIGLTLVLLLSIPAIFAMPGSPVSKPSSSLKS